MTQNAQPLIRPSSGYHYQAPGATPSFASSAAMRAFRAPFSSGAHPRHVLDRLEFLALDDVEVAQDFFGLVAHHGVDLALDALGGAGGVVHQTADLVEKPIAGLGHWNAPVAAI